MARTHFNWDRTYLHYVTGSIPKQHDTTCHINNHVGKFPFAYFLVFLNQGYFTTCIIPKDNYAETHLVLTNLAKKLSQ